MAEEKVAYVYRLGETGIYKVGKTTDLEQREKAFDTILTEERVLHAKIETTDHTAVENFIKEQLQAHRWLDGKGKDLYQVEREVVEVVIEAARRFNAETLPRIAEAKKLVKLQADGRVLTPGDVERELHRELLIWRQREAIAQQEMERIKAELMLVMQAASQLDGIATFKNKLTPTLDQARLKRELREVYDAYHTKVTITRPFNVRW